MFNINAVRCIPTCQNGGTCHVTSSSAHCYCQSGYTGSYCQNRGIYIYIYIIIICQQILLTLPCFHSKVHLTDDSKSQRTIPIASHVILNLVDQIGVLSVTACGVYTLKVSTPCIFAVPCTPTCQNGGRCRHTSSSSAYCDCPNGYTGSSCQYRGTQLCTYAKPRKYMQLWMSLCHAWMSFGTLNMHLYTCVCFTIYFTVTCNPSCQNGGTCHISSSSAHCVCPSGYTGPYCQSGGMHSQDTLHALMH